MRRTSKIKAAARRLSHNRPIPLDDGGITDAPPPMWGADWLTQFAANFSVHPGENKEGDETITDVVHQAIMQLPDIEQRIIIDYYILCLSRRLITLRCGLAAEDVDLHRRHAERRLRGILAEFVKQRFGLSTPIDSECPYCRSSACEDIARELSARDAEEAWGPLRRRLNEQFGLDVRRVQPLITHCRFHGTTLQKTNA